MQLNATVIDSSIYHDIFSTTAMRAVWSDLARIQRYLDVEKALSVVEARLGVIPSEAAEEIGRHCNVSEVDFEGDYRGHDIHPRGCKGKWILQDAGGKFPLEPR